MRQTYINTKVQKNTDGSICVWFSPEGKPRIRYLAQGYLAKHGLDGRISLHLLKNKDDWDGTRLCYGYAEYFAGSFFPYQPLGDKKINAKTGKAAHGICPPKHEEALEYAIFCIPKLRELLK